MPGAVSGLLARAADAVWPRSLSRQVWFETSSLAKFSFSKVANSKTFHGKRGLLVNVGCGENLQDGWINIDLVNRPGVVFWDCRKSLPFDDNSADVIFAEHIFEHFEYKNQSGTFLREALRCLSPGGVLRIVVPDGGLYLSLYNEPGWDGMVRARPLVPQSDHFEDGWLKERYKTKMEFVNAIFRQGTEHKFIYDAETLIEHMRECGFDKVIHQSFNVSASPTAPLDSTSRAPESLYVEGIK